MVTASGTFVDDKLSTHTNQTCPSLWQTRCSAHPTDTAAAGRMAVEGAPRLLFVNHGSPSVEPAK